MIGPKDGVIVITHTGETSYALAVRALAFTGGLDTVTITKRGTDFPRAIETVDGRDERDLHGELHDGPDRARADRAGARRRVVVRRRPRGAARRRAAAIEDPGVASIPRPERALVLTGAGPAAITAREGALKVREAARVLAEGYDVEYLLHGSAVPLDQPRPPRHARAARRAAGRPASPPRRRPKGSADTPRCGSRRSASALLAQIPLTVRLQMLALRMAQEGGQDPDTVIVGAWADDAMWRTGCPEG